MSLDVLHDLGRVFASLHELVPFETVEHVIDEVLMLLINVVFKFGPIFTAFLIAYLFVSQVALLVFDEFIEFFFNLISIEHVKHFCLAEVANFNVEVVVVEYVVWFQVSMIDH